MRDCLNLAVTQQGFNEALDYKIQRKEYDEFNNQ
jgi:hypothetical protein